MIQRQPAPSHLAVLPDTVLFLWLCVQLLDPPPVRTLAIVKTTLTVMVFVFAALQIRQGQNAD